jgi:hypothetical protein
MQRWKLAAGSVVASGLLAAGMFAAFNLTASAATNSCSVSPTATQSTALTCTVSSYTITTPQSISLAVTTTPGGVAVDLSWSYYCTDVANEQTVTKTGTAAAPTTAGTSGTFTEQLGALPLTDPASCTIVSATVTQNLTPPAGGSAPANASVLGLAVDFVAQPAPTPSATPSPTPSASTSSPSTPPTTKVYNNQVHGFDGTCVDDKGNSSAKRASVIIWTCNNTDQAQGWTFSGSELKIHGMCVNAKGNGKSGSKLILWTCNGSANEIWTHRSNGEFAEKANGWTMCIDDPAYSTKNGTQLFVYKCNNGANQHWSKP